VSGTDSAAARLPVRATLPTTPPDDAVLPGRHPDAPAPGEPIPAHYRWCVGCGDDHPSGLHMQVTAGEGLSLTATFLVGELHQGAPGLAHGGMLALAFDEALGALNWLLRKPAVTGRLETDFRRPVPVGETLHIRAEITGMSGRKVFTRAEGRLGSPQGPVAVTAAALFVIVGLEHFVDHGRAADVQAALSERGILAGEDRFEVNP
jgi:acyl-coenzyme A thioesterase PaaI-like protein